MAPRPQRPCAALLIALSLGVCASACSDDAETGSTEVVSNQPTAKELFGPSIARVVIEVDYAAGAAPYSGNIAGFGETWGLFRANAAALLGDKELVSPASLADMQQLDDVSGDIFDQDALLAIAARHRDHASEGSTASYYVLWVDGLWDDGEQVKDSVLGISLVKHGLIAMFKPVIEDLGSAPGPHVEKIVEQTTLVHEFGHAIGLVNNGLELTSDHQDDENGVHCSNTDCVMFFEVAGRSGAMDFVQRSVKSDSNLLWGSECLDDVAAARR